MNIKFLKRCIFREFCESCCFLFFLTLAVAVSAQPSWIKQSGRFATVDTPNAMKISNGISIDSIQEGYISPKISLGFDSEIGLLPPELQKDLELAVAAWIQQRKQNWAKNINVEDDAKRCIASIYSSYDSKVYPERPYYLYFGFSVKDTSNFSIHIRFRELANLDDIERILKSIRLKTQ